MYIAPVYLYLLLRAGRHAEHRLDEERESAGRPRPRPRPRPRAALRVPAGRVVGVQRLEEYCNYGLAASELRSSLLTSRLRRCSTTQSSFTVGLRICNTEKL